MLDGGLAFNSNGVRCCSSPQGHKDNHQSLYTGITSGHIPISKKGRGIGYLADAQCWLLCVQAPG